MILCLLLFQITATFDMIGYPKWIEDPEKLDEYYENVSFDIESVQKEACVIEG